MQRPTIERSYERRWLVLAVLCTSVLLVVVANMALNVALPTIGRDLDAPVTTLQWIVDVFVLCFAGLLLPAAALGDRYGRKGALQAGLVVFLAGCLVGATASSAAQLITGRAVMGVGAALVMPGTLSILATVFPPQERATAIGIWAAVAGAAVAVSITWSGFMLDHFWWGSIFYGMGAVALLALVAGAGLLPTSSHADAPALDPIGAALSIAGVGSLLYGFIEAPNHGWASATVLLALAGGVVGLLAFVAWERRHPHAMLDVDLFRNWQLSIGSLSIATVYFALFGMYFVFTQYFQDVRGYSPLVAGACALPHGIGQLVVASISRPLTDRLGVRPMLLSGLTASSAGLAVLATTGVHSPVVVFELGLGLLGVGIGLAMPPATSAIMRSVPPAKAGVGSALNDLTRELGGAFGIGLLGSITITRSRHAVAGGADAAHAFTSGLTVAMLAGAGIVAVVTVLAASRLPRRAAAGDARVPAGVAT